MMLFNLACFSVCNMLKAEKLCGLESQKLTLVHAYVLTSNAIVVCTSEGQLVWSVGREYHLVAV